jgi:hypothetical protein
VIALVHVATGAALGAVVRSRAWVTVVGVGLHLAQDSVPHKDTTRRFEIATGLFGVGLVAGRRGLLDPTTIGALACSAPDVEHVVPMPFGSSKLFHEGRGWHRSGSLSVKTQVIAASLVLSGVLVRPR